MNQKQIISCCGVICSECEYYPNDCGGCPQIEGKAFWLQYTGGSICEIYDCCINHRKLRHCGQCPEYLCQRYDLDDPTKTPEENAAGRKLQKAQLDQMKREDEGKIEN